MRYAAWCFWWLIVFYAVVAGAADSWLALPAIIGAGVFFVVLTDDGDRD